MNDITKLTRMNIFNLFKYGFKYKSYETKHDYYDREYQDEILLDGMVYFHGRLDEIDFLKRIYDLENIEGTDGRFHNALQDIYQHRIRNYDFEDDWVFEYEPFNLIECNDETFLEFIAEIFNPYVRDESSPWSTLLNQINDLLYHDGYEMYVSGIISGQEIYSFKKQQSKVIDLSDKIHDVLSNDFVIDQIEKCNSKLKSSDFSGAITNARTLVEEVLLAIEEKITGSRGKNDGDISKMYTRVKKVMNFDPSSKSVESSLKQVLSGLNSIVVGLGSLRSRASDSHATNYKPDEHHAELAVNSAFTFVNFTLKSYLYQVEKGSIEPKVIDSK